jgi:Fur family transcriptional regulator, peroxide stress response regulator
MMALKQAKRDVYLNALRQAGKRITEQRRAICDYLAQTESHPTPYQVFADLSAQHPEISRATVYNTLNVLQELGAIVEIGAGVGHTQYETDTEPHVNLICLRCHEISDHPGPLPLADVQASLQATGNFLPMAMRVEVFGFCERCRERKKAEIREQWLAQQQPQKSQNVSKE